MSERFSTHLLDAVLEKKRKEREETRKKFIERTFAALERLAQTINLRSFRHFFRWAYASELDERKLRLVLEDALMLKDKHRQDIVFIRKLKSSVNKEDPEYQEQST
ncbi:hypothetical protein [Thermacetogenium phaeum]|uniref:hypothetical protein n=1 Tax=Thermacetogenium phaeum TaxID=85874 RepID=UPI0002D8DA8E|nr:hypothetical protein [Thermacetogenium phaeum]